VPKEWKKYEQILMPFLLEDKMKELQAEFIVQPKEFLNLIYSNFEA